MSSDPFSDPYDNLDRLTTETYSSTGSPSTNYSATYTYDNVGNRLTEVLVNGSNTTSTTDTYDARDRLTGEAVSVNGSPASATTDTYDSNGSLIQSQTTIGTQTTTNTYSYDARGRLLTAQVNGQTVSYTYDDNGNKISETAGALVTMYTIDEDNPTGYSQVLEERTGTPANPPTASSPVTTSYAIGNGLIAQTTFFANASAQGMNGTAYFLTDGHGSTRELFLPDGSQEVYNYDAFGNLLSNSSQYASTSYLYSGEHFDSALGQYYWAFRPYDTATGRFLQADDPRSIGSLSDLSNANLYLYGAADGINHVDPTAHGLIGLSVGIGIRTALAAFSLGVLDNLLSNNPSTLGALETGAVWAGAGFLAGFSFPLVVATGGVGIATLVFEAINAVTTSIGVLTAQNKAQEYTRLSEGIIGALLIPIGAVKLSALIKSGALLPIPGNTPYTTAIKGLSQPIEVSSGPIDTPSDLQVSEGKQFENPQKGKVYLWVIDMFGRLKIALRGAAGRGGVKHSQLTGAGNRGFAGGEVVFQEGNNIKLNPFSRFRGHDYPAAVKVWESLRYNVTDQNASFPNDGNAGSD